jgi:glucose-6-phosphate dehydrogenase assembly protein OpcA
VEKRELNADLQPITLEGPRAANVSSLEAELDGLWRSAARDAEGRDAIVRACALTLIIYTESEEGAREVSELVGSLTLQNPCRALILVVQPDESPAGLSATISAVCQLPAPGVKQVCCEHVTLVARGERVYDLDKVVLPLMVSGLPVGLWWRAGCQLHFNYFGKILRYIDRVYVDSEWHAHPESDLPALALAIREASSPAAITDMNWARITPWRELAAACFDPVERRAYLDAISQVRIEYRAGGTGSPDCRAQAFFFTAWLAERLDWKPAGNAMNENGEGKRQFRFKGRQGDVQVQLVPGQSGPKCSSGFLTIEMRTAGDAAAVFSLVCGAMSKSVVTRVEIPGHPPYESTAHLRVFDEIELLNEELKLSTRDRGYERVLAMVTSMTT